MEKLKRIHVIGGALGLMLVLVGGAYFGLIKNVNAEIEKTIGELNTTMGGIRSGATDADEVEPTFQQAEVQAKKELEQAQADFKLAFAQFEDFKKRYRRITFRKDPGEFEDVFPQLLAEYRDRLIPDFVAFVEQHGCTLVQIPQIGLPPMPPIKFPNGALLPIPDTGAAAANAGLGGLGDGGFGGAAMGGFGGGGGGGPLTITVHGTYTAIGALLKRLPTFNRLCLMGPVTFRNVEPTTETVEASFSLTFYLVADGPEDVVKKALAATASAAAGGDGATGVPGMPGDASAGVPGGVPGGASTMPSGS